MKKVPREISHKVFFMAFFEHSQKKKISSLATATTAASEGIFYGKQKSGTVKMTLVVLDVDEGFDERKKD